MSKIDSTGSEIKADPFAANKKYEDFSKEYKSIGTSNNVDIKPSEPIKPKLIEVKKPGWIKRKSIKIKKAMGEFWVLGKQGFFLGCMAGGALGFLLGGYESFRMRSLWPLPLAMIGSAFSFGCIFAISTVIRSESGKGDELEVKVLYFDRFEGRYKMKSYSLNENYSFSGNKNI